MQTLTYPVPDVHCAHCEAAISREVGGLPGVEAVEVDLGAKLVRVRGSDVDDAAVREAIAEAGYDVA